jgi:hypothetical protein
MANAVVEKKNYQAAKATGPGREATLTMKNEPCYSFLIVIDFLTPYSPGVLATRHVVQTAWHS